jgi:LPS export ABC transporter protein LptC
MLRLASISLLTIAAATIAYLPYTQQGTKLEPEKSTLLIEMTNVNGMLIDRVENNKRFRFHAENLSYNESEDVTTLIPYHFTGTSAANFFKGNSKQAYLHGDRLELRESVQLNQAAETGEVRTLTTEILVMNTKKHTLTSPEDLKLIDSKQTIQADSLSGNYEEGNYEFTHHVKSHWQ